MPHLVAGRQHLLDRLGIAIGCQARDEESRPQPVLGQQCEQTRDARARAERLVRHDHRLLGIAPAFRQNRRLGVDVEREYGYRRMSGSPIRHRGSATERHSWAIALMSRLVRPPWPARIAG
jgi:hypothetical protein